MKFLTALAIALGSVTSAYADSPNCLVYIENSLDGREFDSGLVKRISISALSILDQRGYAVTENEKDAQYKLTLRYSFAEVLERFAIFENKASQLEKTAEVSGSILPWNDMRQKFKSIIDSCPN